MRKVSEVIQFTQSMGKRSADTLPLDIEPTREKPLIKVRFSIRDCVLASVSPQTSSVRDTNVKEFSVSNKGLKQTRTCRRDELDAVVFSSHRHDRPGLGV